MSRTPLGVKPLTSVERAAVRLGARIPEQRPGVEAWADALQEIADGAERDIKQLRDNIRFIRDTLKSTGGSVRA